MKNYCPKCGTELGSAGMLGHNCLTTPNPTNMEETAWEKTMAQHETLHTGNCNCSEDLRCNYTKRLKDFFRKELQLAEERAERKGREEAVNALSEYTEHTRNCILSLNHAGRPTEDGGYEHLYGDKWYSSRPIDNTPECECGLSKLLTPPEETNGENTCPKKGQTHYGCGTCNPINLTPHKGEE